MGESEQCGFLELGDELLVLVVVGMELVGGDSDCVVG